VGDTGEDSGVVNALATKNEMSDMVQAPLHERLVGVSRAIQELQAVVERLAGSDLTVLVTGESGTGKDVAARILHRNSPRYGKPFIKVNCPAIPESILESELFGYERGAFTGAGTSKPGRFELANNGTIFLDEIAETSITVQGKLLQVLDGEPVMRIGGVEAIHANVRIIAATNVDLERAVRDGAMREDIYFRLSEVVVHMPPLRERPEDVPVLAEHFNFNYSAKMDKPYSPIPDHAIEIMQGLRWEGNVRELGARVKQYVATGRTETLLSDDRPSTGVQTPAAPKQLAKPVSDAAVSRKEFIPLKEATRRAIEETERALIEEALRHTLWNRRKAAKMLGISYSSLLRRIDAYKIGRSDTE
jgi:two-component system response regulator AtoC